MTPSTSPALTPGPVPDTEDTPKMPETPPEDSAENAPATEPASPSELPAPTSPLLDREAALLEREAAIAVRERRFLARENLLALSLPEALLDHFDFSSDASVEAALQIASLASQSAPVTPAAPVPAASAPPAPSFATYLERARLFQQDPAAYALMVNERKC